MVESTGGRIATFIGGAFIVAVYAFLIAPILLIVVMSLNSGDFLQFPIKGVSFKWYASFFNNESFRSAFVTSLIVATISTIASLTIGVPAALYVVRHAGRWREPLGLVLTAPLMLPEILTAIALLFFLYATGLGTKTLIGLQIGHILVTLPFVFLNASASLYNFDRSIEQAARGLGATPWIVFRRITLPLIKPGVIAGGLFAFIISFDLFNMSLLLKAIGTNTLPLALYDYLRWDFDPTAAAAASVSIVATIVIVVVLDRTVGLRTLRF
jgi:putative spermidine/putrescine transport system permease protein